MASEASLDEIRGAITAAEDANDPALANLLQRYAALLRQQGRLLDAVNVEARINVLKEKDNISPTATDNSLEASEKSVSQPALFKLLIMFSLGEIFVGGLLSFIAILLMGYSFGMGAFLLCAVLFVIFTNYVQRSEVLRVAEHLSRNTKIVFTQPSNSTFLALKDYFVDTSFGTNALRWQIIEADKDRKKLVAEFKFAEPMSALALHVPVERYLQCIVKISDKDAANCVASFDWDCRFPERLPPQAVLNVWQHALRHFEKLARKTN